MTRRSAPLARKSKNPVDAHVGRRVRMARLAIGLSQDQLGERLGVTFQQVQKYEKGKNRLSAGRIVELSGILFVPVSYFFDGLDSSASSIKANESLATVTAALSTSEGLRIAGALARISDAGLRRILADLFEAMAMRWSK